MKLRNKKTGEIGYLISKNWNETVLIIMDKNGVQLAKYNSLAELNADWEDVPEEAKKYWYIDTSEGSIVEHTYEHFELTDKERKETGNYFLSEEEAEKAVEKLEAWKRLKDKGFRFDGYHIPAGEIHFNMEIPKDSLDEIAKDMDVCFGGEE